MISKNDILKALQKVNEPDLAKDIVSLGLVSNISISDEEISFTVETKNAALHARKRMVEACEFALERSFGDAIKVNVDVIAMKKSEAAQQILPNIKNIVAVVSGKGGVGKSTVAANIATGLAKKGLKVGIVDADIYLPWFFFLLVQMCHQCRMRCSFQMFLSLDYYLVLFPSFSKYTQRLKIKYLCRQKSV